MRIKYKDEDDDVIMITSDDDVQMAFESVRDGVLDLWVSIE